MSEEKPKSDAADQFVAAAAKAQPPQIGRVLETPSGKVTVFPPLPVDSETPSVMRVKGPQGLGVVFPRRPPASAPQFPGDRKGRLMTREEAERLLKEAGIDKEDIG